MIKSSMLGFLPLVADEELPRLEQRLRTDPPHLQLAVLSRIHQLGPKADHSLPAVHRLLKEGGTGWTGRYLESTGESEVFDYPRMIRRAAAETMIRVSPADPRTAEAYGYLMLQDPDPEARLRTVFFLGQQGPAAAAAVRYLRQLLKGSSPRVRGEAITALGMIGPAAKEATPALEKLIDHEDKQIAERAKAALRQIRGK